MFALFGLVKWAIYITITMEEAREPTIIYTYVFDHVSEQWPDSTLVKVEWHANHSALLSCSVRSKNSTDQSQRLNTGGKRSHFQNLYLPCYDYINYPVGKVTQMT
jgi:hypothetical protein